jgi:hypothetical protein
MDAGSKRRCGIVGLRNSVLLDVSSSIASR